MGETGGPGAAQARQGPTHRGKADSDAGRKIERKRVGPFLKLLMISAPPICRFLAPGAAVLIASIMALSLQSSSAEAQDAQAWQSQGDRARHIVVTLNKSRIFKIGQPFSSVIVGQPEFADVLPMTDNSIYIQGKKVGTTNVSVFAPNKQRLLGVLDLEVVPDTGNVGAKIQSSTGGGNIRVTSSNGQVVLSGEATDAVSAERAVSVAKGLSPDSPVVNAMKVSPSQQVMLKVRFLEASREAGNALGVNWFVFNNKGTRGVVTEIRVRGAGASPLSKWRQCRRLGRHNRRRGFPRSALSALLPGRPQRRSAPRSRASSTRAPASTH